MITEQMEASLEKAKNELSYAIHLEECGGNAGIRKINANKANWLKWVIYLAEIGLEHEKISVDAEVAPDTDEPVSVFQQVMTLFKSINNSKVSIK